MMLRLAFLALGLSSIAAAQSSSSQGGEVVATVNGTPIYASELPIQTKLASLKRQEYDAKVQAARELAAKKIVEKAAKAKGQTVDQFLAAEVDDRGKEQDDAHEKVEVVQGRGNSRTRQLLDFASRVIVEVTVIVIRLSVIPCRRRFGILCHANDVLRNYVRVYVPARHSRSEAVWLMIRLTR